MSGMNHSSMSGMNHSQNQSNTNTTGMDMDHSGMDQSGMDHSSMSGMSGTDMSGMDKMSDMSGMGHGSVFYVDTKRVQLLFKNLQTTTHGEYVAAWVVVFVAAVLNVYLKSVRANIESYWAGDTKASRAKCDRTDARAAAEILFPLLGRTFPLRHNAVRSIIASTVSLLDYSLMLIAMSFNVGIFFAVILGIGVGFFILGHTFAQPKRPAAKNQSDSGQGVQQAQDPEPEAHEPGRLSCCQ